MSTKRLPRNVQKSLDAIAEAEKPRAEPTPTPAPATEPAMEPEPTAQVQASPEPNPATDRESTPEYWRAKFNTVDGMLRASEERHRQDLATREQQVTELRKQVDQLQQQVESGTDPTSDLKLSDYYSPEEIEQHGEEYLRSVLRGAMRANRQQLKQAVDREIAPLREELATARQSVEDDRKSQAKRVYDDFLNGIAKAVPNWAEINSDPRFVEYLKGTDDATGLERQLILSNAEQRHDSTRAARVFSDYLKSIGAQPQKRDVNARLHPEGSGGGNEPPLDTRPLISAAEIRQFQNDVSRGRYRGKAKELAEMEARINEAHQTGRVAP